MIGPSGASATDSIPFLTPTAAAPTRSRQIVRPLAADRYEIRFTARAATREKLQLASDLLRHAALRHLISRFSVEARDMLAKRNTRAVRELLEIGDSELDGGCQARRSSCAARKSSSHIG